MRFIYLQSPLSSEEQEELKREFPHYSLLDQCTETEWKDVEILYGNCLKEKELHEAKRLRWIHSPNGDFEDLCCEEIFKKGTFLVTMSKGCHFPQIAEFVLAGLLSFAKHFPEWAESKKELHQKPPSDLRQSMWTLKDKLFLQIGLEDSGSETVRLASLLGMKTWSVCHNGSFHPYSLRTFTFDSLHSLLRSVDVMAIALPEKRLKKPLLTEKEFANMKDDAILIVIGPPDAVDERALVKVIKEGKFRGVLLDTFVPGSPLSELANEPRVLFTPHVASSPSSEEFSPFWQFRKNLRLFNAGQFKEMKNLISSKLEE